ncbi:MAG: Ig-like domain-containing protein [Clostridia bacterium]|nr:Ig-like domain-containing protein [Clostridia bacterium]
MKKSKLLKALVALAVSIVAAIGCIGLVACGGGEAVNSVRLNKTSVTLQVNGTETLIATTDPAGANVNWTSADSTKVEVDQNGKLTAKAVTATPVVITAKAGDKTATCNVTVEEAAPAWPKTNELSIEELIKDIAGYVEGYTGATKEFLKPEYFEDGTYNSFLDFTVLDGTPKGTPNKNHVCASNRIEVKGDGLTITFEGPGTLTIGFCSTNDSKTSGIGIKTSDGTLLKAKTLGVAGSAADVKHTPVAGTTTEGSEYNEGYYLVTGAQYLKSYGTVVFDIPAAGTYTISAANWGNKFENGENKPNNIVGTSILSLKMVDNGPQA